MSDKSAADLERDAEIARAKVADTAETIRSRITPGQLMDEFTGMFSGGDGSAALGNLKAQVRDNPLALTLVGAGLALLMVGGGSSSRQGTYISTGRANQNMRPIGDFDYASSSRDGSTDLRDGDPSIGARVSQAAGSLKDMASDALDSASAAASNFTRSVKADAGRYTSDAGRISGKARETVAELFQREPLVLAALGLSIGTVVGAMLPSTSIEDEQLGSYRDQLRDKAADLLKTGASEAKDLAAETYMAVKDGADRQASGEESGPLLERASAVVKSAANSFEQGVRERVDKITE